MGLTCQSVRIGEETRSARLKMRLYDSGTELSYAFRTTDGYFYPTNQYATWAAGKVNDFSVAQTQIQAPVPEPSSAALLGLGGLALILRRKK